ncbi:putative pyrogallol hydroxytransferase small subunit [Desulfamplus magnetovallimortis]|uniref:Putative pyrogallol hydroxytransferase small subunit n=1 Tax=Desulfamplus magnetovallimortis TaxID=1246637 RepID=A0A1W1HGR2_9BACT|nr:4Fe-4S dicluster domain-containing protein [Desulfamplus magnetovallimortis]SLM31701.1 putative pyrogallol hydroxytransferase small subunit [Desulfamplus magnetovallimortis]
MARKTILIDVNRCTGCYNCFLACRDEHFGNDYLPYSAAQPLNGQFWMRINEIERGKFPRPKLSHIPNACMHCEAAPCISAAKNGAVYKRDDGIVVIDPEKAKGQKDIVNACPYRAIYWNEELEIPQKCTMCVHRLEEGEKMPRCVESCPTGAMYFGDIDDPESEISKVTKVSKTESFHPEYGTAPSVKYIGIPKRFVAGEVVLSDQQEECAEGVKIILEGNGEKREILSDAYGDFEFEGLEKNSAYSITVEKDGYDSCKAEFFTRTDVNLGEIVISPA